MGINNQEFDQYGRNITDSYGRIPVLRLDDLTKLGKVTQPKLSLILSFNDWRREQIARSLETIARQKFRDFEVLVCENGSTQDMESIYTIFEPYINLKVKRIERDGWSSDPTRGIVEMLPYVSGDVIATMQPEMMLHPDCFDYLYGCHYGKFPEVLKFVQDSEADSGSETYVNIRNYFLSNKITQELDAIDWHSDIRNIENHPEFFTHSECLSNMTNRWHWNHKPHEKWVWWFVSSAKKSATVWEDMPTNMTGHATIDFYLLNYKRIMKYLEYCPQIPLAYHQEHTRSSISPQRDDWVSSQYGIDEYIKSIGRKIPE